MHGGHHRLDKAIRKCFSDTSADAFMMVSDDEPGLHNSHYVARAVFLACLHYAFQEQKASSRFTLTDNEFQLACSAHEQSIGERHRGARAALAFAKCGLSHIFVHHNRASASASSTAAPRPRTASAAASSTRASAASSAASFARGSDLVTGGAWRD